jgi:hypothetical protein
MRLLLAPLALALGLHAALLTSAESPIAPRGAMAASMQVRALDTGLPPPSVQAPAPPAAAGIMAAAVPAPRHARTGAPGREADRATVPSDEAVPVYRTRVPPSATLRYDLRKGELAGSGELSWTTDGAHYEARLEGRVAGLPVVTQTSSGALDANGVAPLRYTDARLRRGAIAANFQRDKGKITYSGPQAEFALVDGAQDRLSWMLQIAAVLNAQPRLGAPGEQITLFVTGASGDADVWVFRCAGPETVETPSGALRAVKFTRAARHAHDQAVDVWLAPSLGHLPVRARFSAVEAPPFELLLRDMQSP